MPLVVGLRGARRRQPLVTLLVLIAKHADQHPRQRVAGLVVHMAGDDTPAGQPELDVLDLLAVGELQRGARLKGTALAIRERYKA